MMNNGGGWCLDGAVIWTQESHRGSKNMQRGSLWFSPSASVGDAVPGRGRQWRRTELGGSCSVAQSLGHRNKELGMGMVAREDGRGGDTFYRAGVKGGSQSGERVIVGEWIFNSTRFKMEYRGGESMGWHYFGGGEEAAWEGDAWQR
jgi:hypothetical protein